MAVALGEFLDRLCIVGGIVPVLLIDRHGEGDEAGTHPGTNDLDVALAIALVRDGDYTEITRRLAQEGFEPDTNDAGNPTPQRWTLPGLDVTVDFLLPQLPDHPPERRIQPLDGDFAAFIMPGLDVVFDERVEVALRGTTLRGEKVERTVPVCGPGAFTILKALAFDGRGAPKDAYDLVYVLRGWSRGVAEVADRLAAHAERRPKLVAKALRILARDFADPGMIGPRRVVEFDGALVEDADAAAADAHGYVDDLLRAGRKRRLPAA
ncbi:MAG TPA: hypothetical protein VGW75_16070 [Solirubrobacteraceae bacterium]|nr:hypothetical protein [Solirubrobacteraceae bacterium]